MAPKTAPSIKTKAAKGDAAKKSAQDSTRSSKRGTPPSKKKKKAKDGLNAVSEDGAPDEGAGGGASSEAVELAPAVELTPASELEPADAIAGGLAALGIDGTAAGSASELAPVEVPTPPPPGAPASPSSAPSSWPPPPGGFVSNAEWCPPTPFVSYAEGKYAEHAAVGYVRWATKIKST